MSKLGNLVRAAREKQNLTQADVGYGLGYTSAQFISNVERGVASLPVKQIAPVSRLLKLNEDAIIKAKADDKLQAIRAAVKGGGKKKRVS